ncbi:hypothetical protein D3C78_1143620 [compost metagenome]
MIFLSLLQHPLRQLPRHLRHQYMLDIPCPRRTALGEHGLDDGRVEVEGFARRGLVAFPQFFQFGQDDAFQGGFVQRAVGHYGHAGKEGGAEGLQQDLAQAFVEGVAV